MNLSFLDAILQKWVIKFQSGTIHHVQKDTDLSRTMKIRFVSSINENSWTTKLFYRIYNNDKKLTFLLKRNPKEKQKIHASLHICIFIHAMRNNWWKYNCTTARRLITCMHKKKLKKKPGELITHHLFVDDVGRTILSHYHQWSSSSCFSTWKVQILEHSPSQRKAF